MERGEDGAPAPGTPIANDMQTNAKHQAAVRATQLQSGPFAGAGPEAEALRGAQLGFLVLPKAAGSPLVVKECRNPTWSSCFSRDHRANRISTVPAALYPSQPRASEGLDWASEAIAQQLYLGKAVARRSCAAHPAACLRSREPP